LMILPWKRSQWTLLEPLGGLCATGIQRAERYLAAPLWSRLCIGKLSQPLRYRCVAQERRRLHRSVYKLLNSHHDAHTESVAPFNLVRILSTPRELISVCSLVLHPIILALQVQRSSSTSDIPHRHQWLLIGNRVFHRFHLQCSCQSFAHQH
jgi:hypothetical protein